ncbi:centrosomal protein kizuna isoform X1 [Carcharodon carcharias]|uniref:centrosomal protein kizuna isoform X1 n=2 Tax=Carcharodon carcharias TaxID=13397 RepID=UPI001B7F08E9|nr:centrosomal protein kizuna isoform X1 [Carcharodon carcharias]
MAASEPAFLEKVGELQRQLHCSEQKRLELEKNLLTCSKSNQLMVRGARLKSYLKELCEREKIAQLRNHQLLKDFESIEAQVTALTSGSDTLKQIKMAYEKQIERLLPVWSKNLKSQGKEKEASLERASNSSRQRVTDVREDLSKALDTTATCILDQQESRTSNRTCTSPQQKHQQHMESFTSSQPYRQTASVTAMHSNSVMDNLKLPMSSKGRQDFHTVSDTIERKTGLQTSEVMPFTPIISSRSERHHYEGIESNRRIRANSSAGSQELPVPVTQLEPIKEELTQDTMLNDFKSRLTDEVNSHKNVIVSEHAPEWFQRLPMDSFHDSVCSGGFSMNIKENNLCQFVSSQNQRKDVEEALMQSQDVQRLADELCDSESDLSISGNAEELQLKKSFEEPCNHKTAINDDPARTSESAFTKDKSSAVSKEEHIVPFLNQPDQKDHGGSVEGDLHEELCEIITQSQQNEGYLSLEGFFHLLQTIEDAVEETMATYSELYQHATMSNEKLQEISSTCNLKGPVSRENLQACGAIVLHQLKRLSQSTSNGCLLSEEILNKDWEAVDGGSHRLSDLPADSATLWDRWYLHVLSMLEHQVLTTDEAAEIFGPLLVAESSNNSKKATALLKKILPKAVENQSLPSDDSSYSLPSIFNDDIEIKSEIPVPWFDLNNTKQQETRAYQLLKQLAMQQNEKDVSDLHSSGKSKQKYTNKLKNEVKDEDNFETGSSEGSPQLRARNKRERINPAKSKAFWGESDDSASDIEAILHPNISEVLEDGDDFDDFF